jgi:ATP-dependent protease ClpP protease subunit
MEPSERVSVKVAAMVLAHNMVGGLGGGKSDLREECE